MQLTLEGIKNKELWKGYSLPEYDIEKMCTETKEAPVWLHFGSGNIFRAFLCASAQQLLNKGILTKGIVCAESFGTDIILECFRPHDNLTISVTLNADGNIEKEVIASIAESVTTAKDLDRITEIFCSPSLQMVSFTITEKGYAIYNTAGKLLPVIEEDMANGPDNCKHLMSLMVSLCIKRMKACGKPLALVSMDNCSHNGEKIQSAVLEIAKAWKANGFISDEEINFLTNSVSYPWSMIDKITPRPDKRVEEQLVADGVEEVKQFVTSGGIYIAPFVNAEKPQYLVIEDDFPNGRPELDKASGIMFADRDTVNNVERMKVCTCLNPLHTALAVYGCLLGHTSIAEEMKDTELSALVTKMAHTEGMPVVVNPGIINPENFLNEVLTQRFPNPFMPDTPQRIATDTSQKLSIRFGESIKAHMAKGDASELKYIPLVLAGWLRYLLAIDDNGNAFEPSSDPLLAECQEKLAGIKLGTTVILNESLEELLSNEVIFGVNLFKAGIADKVIAYFNELIEGPGAVRNTLKKYV